MDTSYTTFWSLHENDTPYSKMPTTQKKNWCELNENEVIRAECRFRTVLHIFRGKENKLGIDRKWQLFCNANWLYNFLILIPPKLFLVSLHLVPVFPRVVAILEYGVYTRITRTSIFPTSKLHLVLSLNSRFLVRSCSLCKPILKLF